MIRFLCLCLALGLLALPATAAPDAECPSCSVALESGWVYCPYDGMVVHDRTCPDCQRAVQPGWQYCPYDRTRLGGPAPVVPERVDQPTPQPDHLTGSQPEAPLVQESPTRTLSRFLNFVDQGEAESAWALVRWERLTDGTFDSEVERLDAITRTRTDTWEQLQALSEQYPADRRELDRLQISPPQGRVSYRMRPPREAAERVPQGVLEFELETDPDGEWSIVDIYFRELPLR